MRNLFFSLLIFSFSFAITEAEKNQLIKVIQGAYKDKIYSVAITKSKEYLKKTDKQDIYRKQIYKILFYSLYYSKNKTEFWNFIRKIESENLPSKDKETFYKLIFF
ncbi:MAG: hypothetical protein GXO21_06345, partial [Aquificae bacterium]|nr:hypothetical protein [Aquificota bacterium]